MTSQNVRALLLGFSVSWMLAACISVQPSTPVQFETPASPNLSEPPAGLPLAKGTKWVYSYVGYEPTAADPTQIITATYLFTETVDDTQAVLPYFVAHVQHEERLIQAPPDWPLMESSRPNEFWYLVKGQEVYESSQPVDLGKVSTDTLTLAYDFPLVLGKSWCPSLYMKGQKIQDCTAAGQRSVISQESFETPAGKFDDCYEITENFTSGGVVRWLCNGVGLVAQKYDHAGTRFGFQQTLVGYSPGSP